MASVNFAVPDIKWLFGDGSGLNKIIQSQVYRCKEVTKRSLNVNRDLCCHLSKMNEADDQYCDIGNVNLLVKMNLD